MSKTLANHRPRKRFGQNFLRDHDVVDAIAGAIGPGAEDHLVEIGPFCRKLSLNRTYSDCQAQLSYQC
ncbi:MAG: hypothetical protein ACJAYC_000219 [Halieaceae bacterium]|jgi:hypothetical protein